jgi:translocation and assembly module TamA
MKAAPRRPCTPSGSGFCLFLRSLLALVSLLLAQQAYALKLDVQVRGLEGEYEKNVLALLGIYQEREDKKLLPLRLQALHRRAPDQIREALAPFGLYRVEVEDSLTAPASEDGTWVASYRVSPGEPVRVGSVDYRITGPGADDPVFPKRFPMKVGDVLLHSEYDKAKEEIRYIAAQQGYLDYGMMRHRVLIDMDAYAAIIEFLLETGHRYYLGDVTFTQDLLDDDYLDKFVTFEPGEPYDPETLLALQGKLIGMEYYEKVEIVPHKDEAGEDRTVPIEVVATPNKANKYRFGLGFATDVGPRVTLEWRRRYLTRRGHKFKLEASISQAIQVLRADYRIPIGNPLRDYITIRPDIRSYDTASRQGDSQSVQVAHSVVTPRGWRRTAGIDYRIEQYEVSTDDAESINELVPNITWSKTVTDDPIYTTDGYRLKYALLGAVEGLISPASYLSGSVRFKWIKSFFEDYRFITRTDLAATWADSVFDLPASRRYFAGGDNSIRGWALDVLGPNNPFNNDAVGGRYLAVGSLELERRIKGNWSGAVFTDFGNAFDPDFTREVKVGAGVGLRWRSPIGQVRMDVAFALSKEGNPARLHLVIGPDL